MLDTNTKQTAKITVPAFWHNSGDREIEIINDSDFNFYDRLFVVSLSPYDFGRFVFAANTQDAIDEVFDFEYEKAGINFFIPESEIDEDETDILRAGNYSYALPSYEVNCFEITGPIKAKVIESCKANNTEAGGND